MRKDGFLCVIWGFRCLLTRGNLSECFFFIIINPFALLLSDWHFGFLHLVLVDLSVFPLFIDDHDLFLYFWIGSGSGFWFLVSLSLGSKKLFG